MTTRQKQQGTDYFSKKFMLDYKAIRRALIKEGKEPVAAGLLADLIARVACCRKARPFNCVCAYSFECPTHGQRHIGSHD